jgi:hypothetical protein
VIGNWCLLIGKYPQDGHRRRRRSPRRWQFSVRILFMVKGIVTVRATWLGVYVWSIFSLADLSLGMLAGSSTHRRSVR